MSYFFEEALGPDGRTSVAVTSAAIARLRGETEPRNGFWLSDADDWVRDQVAAAVSEDRAAALQDAYLADTDGSARYPGNVIVEERDRAEERAVEAGLRLGLRRKRASRWEGPQTAYGHAMAERRR